MSKMKNFLKGLIKENPVLVLVLGTCPTLAISTSVTAAFGMGIAATIVLICSNMAISALRNVIPNRVRIPCYITVIAGFVTVVELVMEAYAYSLYQSLGVYLSVIVVNCIILGRAEMYANKHGVVDSAIDGAGMGLGFTLAICAMAVIREVLGAGTFCGLPIPWLNENPIGILTMAPGGFFVYGCMIALVNKVSKGKAIKKTEFGCSDCAGCAGCSKGLAGKEAAAK
ncbi:MAG: electron transport complex subunit E [Clostridia bacterium]|nr:electron transport complex subunit E [Clostridia bacterium]